MNLCLLLTDTITIQLEEGKINYAMNIDDFMN